MDIAFLLTLVILSNISKAILCRSLLTIATIAMYIYNSTHILTAVYK